MWKFKVQIELWLQSCALLVETEALLRRPQEPHYPKKHGIRARECFLFTREFTLARSVAPRRDRLLLTMLLA